MVCVSAVLGAAAGLLLHSSGSDMPSCLLTGGGAFASSLCSLLAIARYADGQ